MLLLPLQLIGKVRLALLERMQLQFTVPTRLLGFPQRVVEARELL